MKIFSAILCLLITTTGLAQTTFKTSISTGSDNGLSKLIQISDGSYIGIGSNVVDADYDDILLVKLNSGGQLLSSTVISTPGDDRAFSIIKTLDGGFAVAGSLDNDLAILKFDKNLNLQWKKQYITNEGSQGVIIVQTADGGFLVGGNIFHIVGEGDVGTAYLVKTDSQGNLVKAKRYFDFTGDQASIIGDIMATKDGNYAMVATAGSTSYLVKINPSADVLWLMNITTALNVNNSVALSQASDGGLIVGGGVSKLFNITGVSTTVPFRQMLMTKFDSSGRLLWSKSISTPDTTESVASATESVASAIIEDADGGYIFSGNLIVYNFSQLNRDSSYSYIVKLNSAGVLQWTKTFNKSFYITPNLGMITRTSDGGYAMVGPAALDSSSGLYNSVTYKFDNSFGVCGESGGSRGSIIDEGVAVAANVTASDFTPVASDVDVTIISVGTATNLCNILATIYTFTGNGNWSESTNWTNNKVPPSPLPQNSRIVIDPIVGGECILNVPMKIPQGDSITIQSGKKFIILGNLVN